MLINGITQYSYSKNEYLKKAVGYKDNLYPRSPIEIKSSPTFGCSGLFKHKLITFFRLNPINHFNKFNIEEYNTLSLREKLELRKRYDKNIKRLYPRFYTSCEKLHDYCATHIKDVLNERYGKNNYVVIVVGRSLSSIGKVLGYKIGEDKVINIPLSNAWKYQNLEILKEETKPINIELFQNYLKENHLSKNDIETSGKQYVFVDYSCSGNSMKGVKSLFSQLWGEKDNMHFYDPTNDIVDTSIKDNLRKHMCFCEFKNFSTVNRGLNLPQIPYSQRVLSEAPNRIKLIWFKLLDNEMTKNIDIKI